jgi:hypothetical protein
MTENINRRSTGTCPSDIRREIESQQLHMAPEPLPPATIPRRGLLKGIACIFAVGATHKFMTDRGISAVNFISDLLPDILDNSFEPEPENVLFADGQANEVASSLHIDKSSYWVGLDDDDSIEMQKIHENYDWLDETELLPIFPPAVMDYKDMFVRVAKEEDVPVNILGIIATIESAGNPDAKSGWGADGMMQIVTDYHQKRIDRITQESLGYTPVDDEQRMHALRDPYNACKIAADIIKEYMADAIYDTGLEPTSPVVWVRTLANYNGGPSKSSMRYKDMPNETQMYSAHVRRFIMDAAIATGLNRRGYSHSETHKAMISQSIDADAYVLQGKSKQQKNQSFASYQPIWSAISEGDYSQVRDDGVVADIINRKQQYESGEHSYDLDLTPALRIWASFRGFGSLKVMPQNMDPSSYSF